MAAKQVWKFTFSSRPSCFFSDRNLYRIELEVYGVGKRSLSSQYRHILRYYVTTLYVYVHLVQARKGEHLRSRSEIFPGYASLNELRKAVLPA